MTPFWLTFAVQHLTSNAHYEDLSFFHLTVGLGVLLHSSQIGCLLWLRIMISFCCVGCDLLATRNCANVLHPDGGSELENQYHWLTMGRCIQNQNVVRMSS